MKLYFFYMLFFVSLASPPLLAVTIAVGILWGHGAHHREKQRRATVRAVLERKRERELFRPARSF